MGTSAEVTLRVPSYIRRNHRSVTPNRYIFLDTEAHKADMAWGSRQTFRLAVLRFDRRRTLDDGWSQPRYETVTDTPTLWERVDAFTHAKARTVIVCHNLGYDLLIADTFNQLPALGWQIESCNIETNRAWMVWSREGRTLVLTDMLSWVGKPLHVIAKWVGMTKVDLPEWEDSDSAWEQRCHTDVAILGDAYHRLMEWIEENDCGMWRPTGAGMSWSAYRHKFYHSGVQHHGREELYALERRATWTGRCEAWRHGVLEGGPFTEWDMTLAYATIARECPLPIAPLGRSAKPSWSSVASLSRKHAVLAHCTISTELPTVPTDINGKVAWPVGTFDTTLWHPELMLARENGAQIEIHHTEVYKTAPILREWGEWIAGLLDEREGVQDALVRAMLKGWARSTIGRFGLRYSSWQKWGKCPIDGICAFTLYEHSQPTARRCVSIGEETLVEGDEREAPDSCPSVMGFIMSECRARLWRAMQIVGTQNVVYCDTDSLWTGPLTETHSRWLYTQGWRPKQTWKRVEVLGPRQLILSGEIKASGIPYKARVTKGKNWTAESWSSPLQQLRQGTPDAVDINVRKGILSAPDLRRVHCPDGSTIAINVAS